MTVTAEDGQAYEYQAHEGSWRFLGVIEFPAMLEMKVANDRLYIRDENSNVVAILDVGTRLWVYQNVSRRIGDAQLYVLAKGQWTGHFVNPAFLEGVEPHQL